MSSSQMLLSMGWSVDVAFNGLILTYTACWFSTDLEGHLLTEYIWESTQREHLRHQSKWGTLRNWFLNHKEEILHFSSLTSMVLVILLFLVCSMSVLVCKLIDSHRQTQIDWLSNGFMIVWCDGDLQVWWCGGDLWWFEIFLKCSAILHVSLWVAGLDPD